MLNALDSFRSAYEHKQFDPGYSAGSLKDFLRYLDTTDPKAVYVIQGQGKAEDDNKIVQHISIKATELSEYAVIDAMSRLAEMGCSAMYITPQSFAGWRNNALTWRINALHVEIDTNEHRVLNDKQSEQVWDQVQQIIANSNFPPPQVINATGSGGLHLYWMIDTLEAYKRNKRDWLKLSKQLTAHFRENTPENALWHVDNGASHDITRLMRLPQSIHKSGRTVKTYNNSAPAYPFSALCEAFDVLPEQRKEYIQHSLPFEPKKKKPAQGFRFEPSKSGYRNYHNKVYWHLSQFIRHSDDEIKNRDMLMHLLLCSLLQIMSEDKARERLDDLNEIVGLEDAELESYMSTTYKKRYIYSKATLNERFEEFGIPALPESRIKLDDETRHAVLSASAHKAAAAKRQASLEKVVDALMSRAQVTQVEVSELTGLSLSTVKRHWKAANAEVIEKIEAQRRVSLASALYSPGEAKREESFKEIPLKEIRERKKREETLEDKPINTGKDLSKGRYFTEDQLSLYADSS